MPWRQENLKSFAVRRPKILEIPKHGRHHWRQRSPEVPDGVEDSDRKWTNVNNCILAIYEMYDGWMKYKTARIQSFDEKVLLEVQDDKRRCRDQGEKERITFWRSLRLINIEYVVKCCSWIADYYIPTGHSEVWNEGVLLVSWIEMNGWCNNVAEGKSGDRGIW